MKRTLLALTISMMLATTPAWAQHGGGSAKPHGSPAPKPATPHGAPAPKPPTMHGTSAPKTMSDGSKAHVTAPKGGATTKGASHGTMKTTKTTGSSKTTATSKTTTATAGKGASSKTTATTTTTSTTLSPVQQKLQKNTNLASKLQSRLPPGTNLELAAAGFRNLGQFVAAVNVSRNLGIPFAELKTRMVDRGMSLGQAIQDARPLTTDTTVVARRAESDADNLIQATEKSQKSKPSGGRK